ncbi:DUF3097 domain-containing protein [Flavimobilis sp. GY10621]|uniref:DUF3097 domain-containing protein n=1 Tax=Flavimobilis rhizosphaerae TaxID=2775421 RepID=A0ABR9DSY0_9MICO|nr:DUF3097 domain-containing protein [Flavimobilis rhizosphaerae]MBD9700123.1 DUF3097 domain-containing protein [Flavimobilis rhizosphaerae]
MHDRYGSDVLGGDPATHHRRRPVARPVAAQRGTVVEEVTTGWVGAVVRVEKSGGMHVVELEDSLGRTRTFPLGPGFWIDGEPVILEAPVMSRAPAAPTRTASGSVAVRGAQARVARGSRLLVEGRHDAELVEKVWGDDLRVEGVVVELLDGVDNLEAYVRDFAPDRTRRLGVLVDHLVAGSKEQRVADTVLRLVPPGTVRIVGHPYVDVWEAVKPARVGLEAWPRIDRSVEWKVGILRHLGWAHADQADVAHGWKRILGTVRSWTDLEPALIGRVEELIDFVTEPTG